jgi:hypothetical protein
MDRAEIVTVWRQFATRLLLSSQDQFAAHPNRDVVQTDRANKQQADIRIYKACKLIKSGLRASHVRIEFRAD